MYGDYLKNIKQSKWQHLKYGVQGKEVALNKILYYNYDTWGYTEV